MEGYEERSDSIRVPRNTGVDGFLTTLRRILTLPRVQTISIDASGLVSYTRIVREGEGTTPMVVDYGELAPWNIIRNGELEEFDTSPTDAAPTVIARMFNVLTSVGLAPIAFVTGANSSFWDWHRESHVNLGRHGVAYGLPLYTDRGVPDHVLVFCAAYVKGSTLAACHKFLVINMTTTAIDDRHVPPDTEVSIL